MILRNDSSEIKIGENAVVNANDLNVSAESTFNANLNSSSAVDLTQKESSVISIAGNVALTENTANLDLNSMARLNSSGNLTIASKSETPTDAANNLDTKSQGIFLAFNINIASPKNSSHIKISDNANISAKRNLAVTSNVIINDPQIGALIVTSTDNSGGESLAINPAVSTAQIKNDSSISTTAAQLHGSTVAINLNVNVDNARLRKLKQDVQTLYNDVKNYLGDSEQLQSFF